MESVERLWRPSVLSSRGSVLLHIFHSFGCGGAQTRFVHLANHFKSLFQHVVVAMNGDYSSVNSLEPNSCVVKYRLELSQGSFLYRLPQKRAVFSAINPDYLITHNWGTIDWALARLGHRARHIHIEDGFGPDETETQKWRRNLARRTLLHKSQVVVPSTTLKGIAQKRWKIATENLHYIPNGIDCSRFAKQAIHARANWQRNGVTVVGTVAALRAEKNLARLIRSIALIRRDWPLELVIVGDGPQRASLEALVVSLGLCDSVTFAGHITDPARLYRSFDLFALTSDTEQMPYTVLEAMAAGRLVVATDVGDIRSMVSPENAPFIVGRDDRQIASAILRAIKDRPLSERIGEANELKARQRYDQIAMFNAFGELYGLSAERRSTHCEPRT